MPLTLQLGRGATEHILQRSLPAGASEHATLAVIASLAASFAVMASQPREGIARGRPGTVYEFAPRVARKQSAIVYRQDISASSM